MGGSKDWTTSSSSRSLSSSDMFKFPSTTYVHKELKAQDLLKRIGSDAAFKRQCSGIKSVFLENVLNPKRMNIPSKELKEIYVFVIQTDTDVPDEFFLKLDRLINVSIQTLYCIQNGPVIRYITAFRYKGIGNYGLSRYIKTDWMTQPQDEEIPVVDSLDNIYLRIISSFNEYGAFENEGIKAYAERIDVLAKLDNAIKRQQKLVDTEVQPKKRFALNDCLKQLKETKKLLTG